MVWNYVILWVVTSLVSYLLTPKPQAEDPSSLQDVKIPSVDEGKAIPVVFGRMEISPFVGWYGDFSTKEIKKGGKK
jgi:hypothetical protein